MQKTRWNPHVTVAAVIEDSNKYLMVRENFLKPVINQPAGHLEENETLLQAIEREVLEETAYIFKPEFLVGIYKWANNEGRTYLRFCFTGSLLGRKSQPLDPDIIEADWYSLDSIQKNKPRSPMVLDCIHDYSQGKRYELEILNELF